MDFTISSFLGRFEVLALSKFNILWEEPWPMLLVRLELVQLLIQLFLHFSKSPGWCYMESKIFIRLPGLDCWYRYSIDLCNIFDWGFLFGSALVFCWLAWRIALCNVWMFSAIPSPHLKAFCLGLTGHCSSSRFANILLKKQTSTELTVIGLVLVGSSVPFSLGINVVLPTQSSEVW